MIASRLETHRTVNAGLEEREIESGPREFEAKTVATEAGTMAFRTFCFEFVSAALQIQRFLRAYILQPVPINAHGG